MTMFNSSIPSFVQVDCDLVVGLSTAAEGDELAEGISWSDTQDSGRPSGAAQSAPAADRRDRAASCSDDEVFLPSTAEDSPPARAPSRLRPRPARSSPPPAAESAARRAAPPPSRPDRRAASPTVARTSVAASSLLQARRRVGVSRIFSKTFNRRSTDVASISSGSAAAAASTTVTSKTPVERPAESGQCGDGDGCGGGGGGGDGDGGGDGPDDWPPSAACLSPVLGTQLSPVLRPSRSPVLRPTRRHPSADASAARVSKHTTGLSTDGTAVSGGETGWLAPTAAQSEAQQSCTGCDAASGGIPSTASSPVIERRRRRRGRRRANSAAAAAADSAVSAAPVSGAEAAGPGSTSGIHPATECTSVTPQRSRPGATASLCGEDGATGRRPGAQTSALSPPVSRRSAGATRRQPDPVRRQPDPVRRLFPATDGTPRASKRRRASLAVDEALRARQPPADPVPTIASQERRRWLSEVTADRRPAPPPPTDADGDRRASDFVRRLRAVPPPSADTAPSATAEPPAPESGGKGAGGRARRGGLVHRLRRLLARSTAFARMSRHSSGGRAAAHQGALRVLVERCYQQAGARLVLGTSCAAGPAGGRVLVLLAAGGAPRWPAVARGDALLLHPPWQRLQPAEGAPVLLPIGGASVEPGSPSPPPPVTLLELSCPCPTGIALPAKCVRPYPRVRSPLRQPQLTQSHLTTVREAVHTDSPLDDTTIMGAIGCGGDVVNTIDANVLHVCQYRCPADSQASDGPEEDWCWSLLVRDGDGTLAELVLPAALVRRHRALVRRGARLRLSGLVVRERTTSDRCPALASLIVRLSGGGDPGFTYILQALLGHSQLAELSADTADTGADTGSDSADRTAGCRSAPPPDVGRRLDLTCRVLAPCEGGGALVLTADGDGTVLHLQRRPEAALLPAAGQTASLTQLWSPGDGQLVFDRYSSVEQRDGVDVPPPETPLRPLTTAATPLELVLTSGHVAGVDEQCASIWTACSACFSDDLTETPGGHFCHFCCRAPPSTVIRMELKVEVACADVGRCRVVVQLLQSTIEALLAKSSGDGEQGYELSSMLGHELTDLSCVIVTRQPHVISLHQVRL